MSAVKGFRSSFGKAFAKNILQWFPGHMGKGLKQLQQQLVNVDCIIEVHDARIPFSGRNELFKSTLLGARPHILVLNKCDLIEKDMQPRILNALQKGAYTSDVIFTDCRTPQGFGVTDVIPAVTNKLKDVYRYNRQDEKAFNLLIIGVPNVGKSSLINVLRNYYTKKKKATKVGPIAGITRSVLTKIQVCYKPPLYLLDSPGILEPQVKDVEDGFRLALCASMQDHLVGITNIADYLLYWLNKNEYFSYVEILGLKEPCDNIVEVLAFIAVKQNFILKFKDPATGRLVQRPDIVRGATHFVKLFRRGELGLFFLDSDLLDAQSSRL